jgi:D-glycero-D-manno-heptose 1,7-bisphosphate phosphatase
MKVPKNKALFLDRDGVINVEQGYVHRRDDFQFKEGIFDLCRAAETLGYLLVVVTNQAGIARGYYTESEFLELTEWMITRFAEEEIRIAQVYYCPYHPIHGVGVYKADSPDRKPGPGMLLRARTDFDLDMVSSVLIGDKLTDIGAAKAAGVGTRILLGAGTRRMKVQDGYWVALSLDEVRRRLFSPVHGRDESSEEGGQRS